MNNLKIVFLIIRNQCLNFLFKIDWALINETQGQFNKNKDKQINNSKLPVNNFYKFLYKKLVIKNKLSLMKEKFINKEMFNHLNKSRIINWIII